MSSRWISRRGESAWRSVIFSDMAFSDMAFSDMAFGVIFSDKDSGMAVDSRVRLHEPSFRNQRR